MKTFLKTFGVAVVSIAVGLMVGFTVKMVFASTLTTSVPSTFETYLAVQQGSGDTTATLANGTLRDGTTFTGYQCVTIDANTPTQEYECGTANGTAMTGLTRGLDSVMGTSTVAAVTFAHRRGADVKVTDYPILTLLDRMANGIDQFPSVLQYQPTTATSSLTGNDIPDVAWINNQNANVNSVSNIDGTLTVSPTGGNVVASLALTHSNVWTAASTTFVNGITMGMSTTTSATTTNLAVTNSGLTGCSGSNALNTTSSGVLTCGAVSVGGGPVVITSTLAVNNATDTVDITSCSSKKSIHGSFNMPIADGSNTTTPITLTIGSDWTAHYVNSAGSLVTSYPLTGSGDLRTRWTGGTFDLSGLNNNTIINSNLNAMSTSTGFFSPFIASGAFGTTTNTVFTSLSFSFSGTNNNYIATGTTVQIQCF